jgi:transposase-like protein
LIAQYQQSGQTQIEFARQHEIKVGTLRQWLRRRPGTPRAARPEFKELLLTPASTNPNWSTEIQLGHEITVRFAANVSATFMTKLVKVLRTPC